MYLLKIKIEPLNATALSQTNDLLMMIRTRNFNFSVSSYLENTNKLIRRRVTGSIHHAAKSRRCQLWPELKSRSLMP